MTGLDFHSSRLSDPRLAAHALSPAPLWLWSLDASRILWANPAGAAIFDAETPAALSELRFVAQHPAAAQIERLAETLPQGGAPQLERLRGFGAALGGALICLCSRVTLADSSAAILVQATERAGIVLPLPERAHRLLADLPPTAALFTADGELMEARPEAQARLDGKRDLIALDAAAIAREATLNGLAEGESAAGRTVVQRLGAGPTFLLLVMFVDKPPVAPTADAAVHAAAIHIPQRFVWQMDSGLRFTRGVEDFAHLLGPRAAAMLTRPWPEAAEALALGPAGEQIAHALSSHCTWSGVAVEWPTEQHDVRLAIEMSGLPVFDRDRQFAGFRGFAICRDITRLALLEERRARPAPEPPPLRPEEQKVVPFPSVSAAPAAETSSLPVEPAPRLSPGEHSAFQELARELSERLRQAPGTSASKPGAREPPSEPFVAPAQSGADHQDNAARDIDQSRPILDRLPAGVLVYRQDTLLYANKAFLAWTGYASLTALTDAGGLDRLFSETKDQPIGKDGQAGAATNGPKLLTISTQDGGRRAVEGRLFSVSWGNESALVLMIDTQAGDRQARANEAALRRLEAENQSLKSILDTATDGVVVLDRAGRVLSINRSAEALFGYEAADFNELSLGDLFAPESRQGVLDYFDRQARGTGANVLDAGREAIGRVRQGGLIPLYITFGRIDGGEKLCAVIRDITAWKRSEEELINARREAEKASTAKSEFLAKISHEIRTPLNAIIGFSEVMIDERFGPLGNERYRQYLKDINASGCHLISLLNDLLDLSKIEAGKLDLTFVSVDLNELVGQCVAMLQQEANRERVIIRTSLPPNLPPVIADARSVRQIALNILSNSIKFTGAGGQVIVSTAVGGENGVVLRIRDTGAGMSEKELQTALEPFRQIATSSRWGGTGLGLPITKALAEANHARFHITSRVNDGTMVEIAFPASRVLAQ